jgi:FG-GAP repeat
MLAQALGVSKASRVIPVATLALLLSACDFGDSSYTIGGTVTGLTGTGLVLQNNGGDNLAIQSNGPFSFSKKLRRKASYDVTVFAQPTGQSCTVSNGSGTIGRSNVTNVMVSCTTGGFTVGGTVSGVTGAGLVLQNNGGDNLSVPADGGFTFATSLANGAPYNVTVFSSPAGEGCSVANGSSTIAGANVTNVALTCAAAPAAPSVNPLGFGVKELQFSWAAVSGATSYQLLEDPDGASGYAPVASGITATSYNYTIPVHRRLNASYEVAACNPGGCTASAPVAPGTDLVQAIGYAKASNPGGSGSFSVLGDQFGMSVAVSGDGSTLAVGAPAEDSALTGVTPGSIDDATAGNGATNSGAVYVFARIAGVWTQQAYVKASNTAASDAFGGALALSNDGNTLAVGARNQAGSGAAYVFARAAGAWTQQAFLKAANANANDLFGTAVALSADGGTLAVGASFESSAATGVNGNPVNDCGTASPVNCASFSGAAYVFVVSGGTWSQQAYVKASNTGGSNLFGSAVALSSDGNTLGIGAPFENSAATGVGGNQVSDCSGAATNCAKFSGAAYVIVRSGGTWSQQAYVKASNTGSSDQFGTSIALSGDGNTLAAGAPSEASSGTGVNGPSDELASGSGAAYVYGRAAGAWSQQAFVKASNTGAGDSFGTSLALAGDGNELAVGAPFEDSSGTGIGSTPDESASNSGAAYFYARSGGTWSQQAYVKASNTGAADQFGTSIALSGDGNALAVGAQLEDGTSSGIGTTHDDGSVAFNSGAAYLY